MRKLDLEVTSDKDNTLKVLMGIVIVLFVLFVGYNTWALRLGPKIYPDFYSLASFREIIPGLNEDFVPQGVTYFKKGDCDLICGYMTGDGPSRIYKVYQDGTYAKIELRRETGEKYEGHAGGITAYGDYVYISNQSKLFVLKASDVAAAKDGDTLQFEGYIEVPCNASFCSTTSDSYISERGMIYVGEYHEKGYDTDESHKLTTPDGSVYYAVVFGYELSFDGQYGLMDDIPDIAFSVCDRVQGFCISDRGLTCLSCSKGLQDSYLKIYKTGGEADGSFSCNGVSVPIYYLDSERSVKDIKMPHMSEDLECVDGKVWISFEAAAKKFGSGWLPLSINRIVVIDTKEIQ